MAELKTSKGKRSKRPIDPEVGARIRRSRESKGMKQNELARRADIRPASLSQIESGETFPRAETLRRIADAVGESVSFLLAGRLIGKKDSYEGRLGRLVDKLGWERIEHLERLSDEAARAMIDQHELRTIRNRRKAPGSASRRRKL